MDADRLYVRKNLADPLLGKRAEMGGVAGRIALYAAASSPPGNIPVFLIHSLNAAASAYEVNPFFDAYYQK